MLHSLWILAATFFTVLTYVFVKWVPPQYEIWDIFWHCCKVSDEAAFCLIQRPYISKTLLTRRISPRGSP